MLEAMLGGISLFTLEVMLFILIGVAFSQVVAVIPGLGGPFTLALLLPLTYGLSPEASIAMLVAALASGNLANSITSILFGIPGSPSGVAAVFDGYPMARRGEGSRAISAAMLASVVGGAIGMVVLALTIPFARPLVLTLGPAEYFLLALLAVILMGSVGQTDALKGVISGFLGLSIGLIGQEIGTGTLRFTYGALYLFDGINIVVALIGLFALTEMLLLIATGSASIAEPAEGQPTLAQGQVLRGFRDVYHHKKTTFTSSIIGAVVGIVPGLGGETAQFMAYSQAAKTSKNGSRFGTGEVEGVIAQDAATNSKDGGALLSTLALGLPGSLNMAILLVAFEIHGVNTGRRMLEGPGLSLTWLILWTLLLANIIGFLMVMPLVKPLSKVTFVAAPKIVAVVFLVTIFGSYGVRGQTLDILMMFLFGILGYLMVRNNFSRVSLVVGMVLGPILEKNLLLAWNISGWAMLQRPIFLGMLIMAALGYLYSWVRKRFASAKPLPVATGPEEDTKKDD
jgi:TctA family transporter